ncbi:MAG: acetolactate synthase-1/2/3 large subunit [Cognaticolwellia sp.]|jgi:acetolactate synthase-1/2/3 large subunit
MNAPIKRVADRLATALSKIGVKDIWGVPGGTISPVVDACRIAGFGIQTCVNETTAAYLAAGVSAMGGVGVVYVTSGPGALGALPAIAAAHQDGHALLVLVGDIKSKERGLGVIQDHSAGGLRMQQVMGALAKASYRIEQPRHAEFLVHRAWQEACSGNPGPVILECPMDVLMAISFEPHLDVELPVPDLRVPKLALRRFAKGAQGDCVLALGAGAVARGVQAELVLAAAEVLDAEVVCEPEARGLMDERHPRYAGRLGIGGAGEGLRAMQSAGNVISLGCRFDDTVTGGSKGGWRPGGAWLQVDIDVRRLGRSGGPDLAWLACPRAVLESLAGDTVATPWVRGPTLLTDWDPSCPRSILSHLHAGPGKGVRSWVSDIGNHFLFLAESAHFRAGERLLVSMGLGGMGSGIGMSMGVARQTGERTVLVVGDGGLRMFGNELLTAARLGLPLTVVVLDDQGLGMVRQGTKQIFGATPEFDQGPWQACMWSESLGIPARRVVDMEDLAWGFAGGPRLLHCRIDPEIRAPTPRFKMKRGGTA